MSLNRIAIISVPVTDQTAARDFYADTLGFDIIRDNPMGPDRRWVQVGPKGAETSLTLVNWPDGMPAGSLRGLVMTSDDIEADRDALAAKGVDITEVGDTPWGRFAMFSDPDGNGWVLQEARDDG